VSPPWGGRAPLPRTRGAPAPGSPLPALGGGARGLGGSWGATYPALCLPPAAGCRPGTPAPRWGYEEGRWRGPCRAVLGRRRASPAPRGRAPSLDGRVPAPPWRAPRERRVALAGFPARFHFPPWRAPRGWAAEGRRRCQHRGRAVPPGTGAGAGALPRGRLGFLGPLGWHQMLQLHQGFVRSRFLLARPHRPPLGTRPAARGEPAAQPRPLLAPPATTGPAAAPAQLLCPSARGKLPSPPLARRLRRPPRGRGGVAVAPVPVLPRRGHGQRNPKSSCPRCAQLPWGFVTRAPAPASPHAPRTPLPAAAPCWAVHRATAALPLQPLRGAGAARGGPRWEKGGVGMGDHRCPASWLSPLRRGRGLSRATDG